MASCPRCDVSSIASSPGRIESVRRHSATVRISHWINVVCLGFLLVSGLQIFNAYPRLHWGQVGANADRAVLEIGTVTGPGGPVGILRIGSLTIPGGGILGLSEQAGQLRPRAFPAWMTLPSWQDLATGRRWHFFFAWLFVINGLVYLANGFVTRHFRRDLVPDRDQLTPRHLLHEVADHARLRFPKGAEARRYNALQKFSYLAVIFVLLPLMLLTGLTMSPGFDAIAPFLLDLFGGRPSARTLHFISASLLVLFVVVHVVMVLVSGVWNNMRSMITGRYDISVDAKANP
ncbi:cytochrome b/b6 domain-containing protein [soil metagenome]